MVTTRAALQEQAKAVAAGGAGETTLLEGDSDSVASAALQEMLQAMFAQAGIQLNSVETLPGEEAGAYRRIRLRVSFNASWPLLMALLKDIELARPALLVDELQVQPALHRITTAPGTFDVIVLALRVPLGSGEGEPRDEPASCPWRWSAATALVATIAWEVQDPAGDGSRRNIGAASAAGRCAPHPRLIRPLPRRAGWRPRWSGRCSRRTGAPTRPRPTWR